MHKSLSWCFLIVFSWQLAGQIVYFEWKHHAIKKEIKGLLKQGVPSEELIDFHFTSKQIAELKWLKKNEFEWNEQLFDVVKSFKGCDGITHFRCISDTQEKSLFKDLSKSVASNLVGDHDANTVFKLVKITYFNNVVLLSMEPELLENKKVKNNWLYLHDIQNRVTKPQTPPPNLNCLSIYWC